MVSKFTQLDMTTQDAASYKANIDGSIAVLAQIGAGFAPRAQDTANMTVRVDPGALFDRSAGGFLALAAQSTAAIYAPGANSKIVRVYIDAAGVCGTVEGSASASPVAPAYPPGVTPLAQVTIAASTTTITNAMISDERAFATSHGTPRNTFLITTSQTFPCPVGAKILRVTAAGGGGGGGGGASSAADAAKFGGGGGGGAAGVVARLFGNENLIIVIGAGGVGGNSALTAGVTVASAATAGTATTVTGVASVATFSCAPGALGGAATAAANGAGGSGGAIGTGIAGTAGAIGVSNTNGGKGGNVGTASTTSMLAIGGTGAVLATTRNGSNGLRGGVAVARAASSPAARVVTAARASFWSRCSDDGQPIHAAGLRRRSRYPGRRTRLDGRHRGGDCRAGQLNARAVCAAGQYTAGHDRQGASGADCAWPGDCGECKSVKLGVREYAYVFRLDFHCRR